LEQGASPFHKRGIALHGNRLYLGTSDVHVVALDVATGEVVWDTTVGDFRRREGLNGGPLVARGKVMVGTTGTGVAAKFGGPQIEGVDQSSGGLKWRVGTSAKSGEPGGESRSGIPIEQRRGAPT